MDTRTYRIDHGFPQPDAVCPSRFSVYRNNTTGHLRAISHHLLNPQHYGDDSLIVEIDADSETSAIAAAERLTSPNAQPNPEKENTTMNLTRTPGPWYFAHRHSPSDCLAQGRDVDANPILIEADDTTAPICVIGDDHYGGCQPNGEEYANAFLICAAPLLLDALKRTIEWGERYNAPPELMDLWRTAYNAALPPQEA